MRKYTLILIALLLAGALRAQTYEKNILGIRAGVNISKYNVSSEVLRINTGSRAGFHIAVSDQILLHRSLPLYLETGVGFSSRGSRAATPIQHQSEIITMRPFYLQVPLLINYHFLIRNVVTIQPFAGIYGGIGARGATESSYGTENIFGSAGILARGDFGIRAGIGIVVKRIYVGVNYDLGCLNQFRGGFFHDIELPSASADIRNNCLTVNVGYNF